MTLTNRWPGAFTATCLALSLCAMPGGAVAQSADDLLGQRSTEQLVAMGVSLRRLCDDGQERACRAQRQLRRLAAGLVVARAGCASGSSSDCRVLEEGTALLDALFVRFAKADGDFFDGSEGDGASRTRVLDVPEVATPFRSATGDASLDTPSRGAFAEDPFERADPFSLPVTPAE